MFFVCAFYYSQTDRSDLLKSQFESSNFRLDLIEQYSISCTFFMPPLEWTVGHFSETIECNRMPKERGK
jgi:hypothetical protein